MTRQHVRGRLMAAVVVVIVALGTPPTLLATDAPEEPPSIGQALLHHLQFATDISIGLPVDNGTRFLDIAPRILTLVGWDYAPFATEISLRLYLGDRLVLDDSRLVLSPRRSGYVFNYEPDGGPPVGQYTAELYYNGVVEEVATFEVVAAGSIGGFGGPTGPPTGDTGPIPYVDPAELLVVTRESVLRANLGPATDAVLARADAIGDLADLEADGETRDTPEETIPEVHRLLAAGDYRYLLIIGNDDAVPFARVPNPMAAGEAASMADWQLPSEWLPSDDPYVDLVADPWGVPDLPVARIPSSEDAELLLTQLGDITPPDGGGYALINQVRRGQVAPVVETMDDEVPVDTWYAPPINEPGFIDGQGQEARYVQILLHGIGVTTNAWSADVVYWLATSNDLDGEWEVGVATSIPVVTIDGAASTGVVSSGACFGAWTLDTTLEPAHKTADNSLALAYLKSGTRSFIGSTHTTYSSINTTSGPYVGVHGFEILFWRGVLAGASPIDAFHSAKLRIAAVIDEAIAVGAPEAAALNLKTLHHVIYLGRP
jgi:hypothetical protein